MAYNRGQIILMGLELAGRTDQTIKAHARKWLNLFLERQYQEFDWKWLEKRVTGLVPSSSGVSLPDDYDRAVSFTLISPDGSAEPIDTVSGEVFDDLTRNPSASGKPKYIWIDQVNNEFRVSPSPSQSYLIDLKYIYLPELVEEIAGADNDYVVWGSNTDILVQSVYARALQFLDDSRYTSELNVLAKMLGDAKMNSHDKRAGRNKIQLGRAFKNRTGRRV